MWYLLIASYAQTEEWLVMPGPFAIWWGREGRISTHTNDGICEQSRTPEPSLPGDIMDVLTYLVGRW